MADLDILARNALAAFRDALVGQLTAASVLPGPLEPHVVGYKRGRGGSWASKLMRSDYVTGKFTTADFAWSGRARFWVTVGDSINGGVALDASVTGFGTTEGLWPSIQVAGEDVATPAAELGRAVALHLINDRYDSRFGWG